MRSIGTRALAATSAGTLTSKLRDSLRNRRFEVKVPADVAAKARVPIERMVSIS